MAGNRAETCSADLNLIIKVEVWKTNFVFPIFLNLQPDV
jgi:hypothetical protein